MPNLLKSASLIIASLAVLGSLTACGGKGGDDAADDPNNAQITSVEPIKETFETPREVCEDVTVTEQAPVKDEHQIAGSATGAVVGGIVGNQVGSGRGKKLATAAGAAAGGYAGNKMQESHQAGKTVTSTETQCTTVMDKGEKVVGYMVKYELSGKPGSVRMDQPPKGDTIPVVNGQLVLQTATVSP